MNRVQIERILSELVPIGTRTRFWLQCNHPGDSPINILRKASAAVARNPNDVEALRQKLACEIVMKKFTVAHETERSLSELSDDADDLNNISISLANRGKFSEAIETLNRAKRKPNIEADSNYYYNSALIHAILGNTEEGKRELEKAIELGNKESFNPFDELGDEPLELLSEIHSADNTPQPVTAINKYYSVGDDDPPRCKYCGSANIRFTLEELFGLDEGKIQRVCMCMSCGRTFMGPAKYTTRGIRKDSQNYSISDDMNDQYESPTYVCPNCNRTSFMEITAGVIRCNICGTMGPKMQFRMMSKTNRRNPMSANTGCLIILLLLLVLIGSTIYFIQ